MRCIAAKTVATIAHRMSVIVCRVAGPPAPPSPMEARMGDMKECPFCGGDDVVTVLDREQGQKWGFAGCNSCAARGPEVRTGYDTADEAPWRAEAIAEWNRRAIPAADARAEALREAASHVFVLLHNTPAYVDARTLRDLVPESILALITKTKP